MFSIQVGEEYRKFVVSTRYYDINPYQLQASIGNVLALETEIGSRLETEETIEDDDMNVITLKELEEFMNENSTPKVSI